MKRNVFVFILFSLIGIHAHAQAQQPFSYMEICRMGGDIATFVNQVYGSKCLELQGTDRCQCLASEKATNLFIKQFSVKEGVEKLLEKTREKRTENFWANYSKMIHGAAFQKEIILKSGVKDSDKLVGCTPRQLMVKFDDSLKSHVQLEHDAQGKAINTFRSRLALCRLRKENCNYLENQIHALNEEHIKSRDEKYKNICETAQRMNDAVVKNTTLAEALIFYQGDGKDEPNSDTIVADIKCMQLFDKGETSASCDFSKYDADSVDVSGLKMAPGFPAEAGVSVKKALENLQNTLCTEKAAESFIGKLVLKFVDDKKIYNSRNKISETVIEDKECNSPLCHSFKAANDQAFNAQKEAHAAKDNFCISYPTFQIMNGMPGDDYLKQLATASDKDVSSLLTVPKAINNAADKQRLAFLRSNPLLVKAATSDKLRQELASALKTMAQNSSSKSKSEKMNDYIAFMNTSLKKALEGKEFKNTEAFLCKEIADNFSRIQMSTDLPILTPERNDTPLQAAVRECKWELNNQISVSRYSNGKTVSDSLEFGDLFNEIEGDEVDKTSEYDRFKKLNEETCDKWPSYKKNCAGDLDKCRESYLASESNFKSEQGAISSNGLGKTLGRSSIERVADYSRENKQDKAYKKWWDKSVGSKLNKQIMGYAGGEEEYAHIKAANRETVAAATESIPQQFMQQSAAPSSMAQATVPQVNASQAKAEVPQSSVNPGQVMPSYSNQTAPVAIDPSKLSPERSVTEAIPNFDQLNTEKKVEGLSQVKNYLESQKKDVSQYDLQEKLGEAEKKNSTLKDEIKKLEKMADSLQAPVLPQATNRAPASINPGSSSSVALPSSQVVKGTKISTSAQGAKAMNDVIVKNHELKNAAPEASIVVKTGVVNTKELKKDLVVSTELVAESAAQFEALSTSEKALQLYLKSHLKASDVGEGTIVMIKDPRQADPFQNLLYQVKLENGMFVVQSMPSTVPVARSVKLKDLQNNLEHFRQTKKPI